MSENSDKAYLSFSVVTDSARNTIMPQNAAETDYTKAVLSYKKSDDAASASLKTWTSEKDSVLSQVNSDETFELAGGSYIFTFDLYTSKDDGWRLTQTASVSKTLKAGLFTIESN